MLAEPPISEEAAGILAEAYESYEHDETSPEEYLSIVTEQRGFTPASTQHAVMINSGSYCSNTGLPIIMKAFLNDNGNAVVKEVLEHYGVVMLDKIPSGGVLIHVRSANDEAKLDGQEVNLMGRKFTIKRRSFLMNKFFLDVSGIHAVEEANALFLALSALGAHPLFLTPRDVNMETQVVSPTWRFYFGLEEPPKCLVVDGCVTHQIIYGRNLYLARGKRSIAMDPPIRATTRRQSRYGVVLPFHDGRSRQEERSHPSHQEEPNTSGSTSSLISACKNPASTTPPMSGALVEKNRGVGTEVMSSNFAPTDESAQPRMLDSPTADLESAEPNSGTIEPMNEPWITQGDASTDIDMSKQLESGFKRLEPSFSHENPYAVLNQPEL